MSRVASWPIRTLAWASPALFLVPAWSDGVEETAPIAPVDAPGDGAPVFVRRSATQQYSIGEPTAEEQQLLELMNRARMHPFDEGDRIFVDYGSPRVKQAVDFFLQQRPTVEYTRAENRDAYHGYGAKPPFAFNPHLIDASRGHSQLLKQYDQQSHQIEDAQHHPLLDSHGNLVELDVGGRIAATGYVRTFAAESVGAYLDDMLHGHAAFAIDFGQSTSGPDGLPCYPSGRPCLGHRLNLMGFDDDPGRDYREVGIGVVEDSDPKTKVGPRIVTIDFAIPAVGPSVFVTGVAYDDANGNGIYDPGEGIGGVRIDLDVGDAFAVTSSSGGYAIPVGGSPGLVHVTATGQPATPGAVIGTQTVAVDVTDANVKADFTRPPEPPAPAFVEFASGGPLILDPSGTTVSSIDVAAQPDVSALVGDVEVEIAADDVTRVSLGATLIPPTGPEVVLFDGGLPGNRLHGVFDSSLSPTQSLGACVGRTYVGTWRLRVGSSVAGNGTLTSWKLRIRPQWVRTLFCDASPLFVSKLTTKNAKKAMADSLSISAIVETAPVPLGAPGGATLRILAEDGTPLFASPLPDESVRRAVNGTSRTTVNAKLAKIDLPATPFPATVVVELAIDDAVVRETVPLKKGAFNASSAKPASEVFHVDSATTKLVAGVPNYTVKGRLATAGTLVGVGTLEVSFGAVRVKDAMSAARLKGKITTYKGVGPTGALKSLTIDAGKNTFTMTIASASVNPGATIDLSLRLGDDGFFGATTIAPTVSGTSLTY